MDNSIDADAQFFPNRKKSFADLFQDGILKDKNPFQFFLEKIQSTNSDQQCEFMQIIKKSHEELFSNDSNKADSCLKQIQIPIIPINNNKKSKYVRFTKNKTFKNVRFTKEDDQKIYSLVRKYGKKWKLIAHHFEGKTPNSIQNRYRLQIQNNSQSFEKNYLKLPLKFFINQKTTFDQEISDQQIKQDDPTDFDNVHVQLQEKTDQKIKTESFDREQMLNKWQFLKIQISAIEQMILRCKDEIVKETIEQIYKL